MRNFIAQWFKRPRESSAVPSHESAPSSHRALSKRSKPLTARQRRMEASLASLRLLPPAMVQRLEEDGKSRVADLLQLNLSQWATQQGLTRSQHSRLRTVRRAIRMAFALRVMHPREAYLLIAIHRSSPADVASDSARHLFRDLERFAMSSRGRALMKRIEFPSIDRVSTWIQSAQHHQFSQLATSESVGSITDR